MKKTLLLLSTSITIIACTVSYSQTITPAILNSTGGTNFFAFYRFEWSFGEAIAINTMADAPNLVVTNGTLQPQTNDPANVNNNSSWASDEIKILPNPTTNLLEINFFSKQQGKVTMSLFNETGQLLTNKQFDYQGLGRIEHWTFERYPSGQYFLSIQLVPSTGSVAKKGTFKVQKIK